METANERQIIKNVADLIGKILREINENNESHIWYSITNYELVQDVLLRGTDNAGGASTYKKCAEIGLNAEMAWIYGEE